MPMASILWLVTVLIVVLATIPAVAHAPELPGKMRLSKDEYVTMQRVYYPGFTITGIAEPIGILLTLGLLLYAPTGQSVVCRVLALASLVAMQAIYWLVTHRVNKVWITGQRLSAASATVFATGAHSAKNQDWVELRSRFTFCACRLCGHSANRVAYRRFLSAKLIAHVLYAQPIAESADNIAL
jgi:hypothetical protein